MPPGAEQRHRQLAGLGDLLDQRHRGPELLGPVVGLGAVGLGDLADVAQDRAQVAHRLDDVAGAGLALGADHGRALADAPQRLAEVGGAAHERHGEGPLVDVVGLVGRRQHLGLVDVVDAQGLEDLRLDEVADAGLGHDRDGDRGHDALDQLGVAHAGDAAVAADVGGHPLERHHRHGAGVLGDLGLRRRDHVHDHAALEHLGQPALDALGAGVVARAGNGGNGGGRRLAHAGILRADPRPAPSQFRVKWTGRDRVRAGSQLPQQGDALLDRRVRVEHPVEPATACPRPRYWAVGCSIQRWAVARLEAWTDRLVVAQLLERGDEPRRVAGHLDAPTRRPATRGGGSPRAA